MLKSTHLSRLCFIPGCLQCRFLPAMAQEQMPDPYAPKDSLSIEQITQIIFQKKVSKSCRDYRQAEATNTFLPKKLKKQEEDRVVQLRTDCLKYPQYLAIKSPDRYSLMQQAKGSVFIKKLNSAGRRGDAARDTFQRLQNFMGKFSDQALANKFNLPRPQQKAAFKMVKQKSAQPGSSGCSGNYK